MLLCDSDLWPEAIKDQPIRYTGNTGNGWCEKHAGKLACGVLSQDT